jgi:ATP-dependent DNA ligase
LRGELCGEKIQGNKMGLLELSYYLYDVWDLDSKRYVGYEELLSYSQILNITICPVIYTGKFNFTLKQLEEMAENVKYPNGNNGEGIVVRPIDNVYSEKLRRRLSFKVISKSYASKE